MPQSDETKIRTRARKLKIGSCYINSNWDDIKKANIIVTRVHSNSNYTVGFFHVDLALFGVLDAFYRFNIPENEFKQLLKENESLEMEDWQNIEVEYNIVHNIIYGSVAFAEDYGFFPHKDFRVAKYILEEDEEHIPLIDIEFGIDGLPTVLADDHNPYTKEIAQLEEKAGPGNYKVIYENNHYFDDDDIEDDDFLYTGWDDDIEEMGVPDWDAEWIDFFKKPNNERSIRAMQYFVDMIFLNNHEEFEDVDSFNIVLGGTSHDSYYDYKVQSSKEEEVESLLSVFKKFEVDEDDPYIILQRINNHYLQKVEKGTAIGGVLSSLALLFDPLLSEDQIMANNKYLVEHFPDDIEVLFRHATLLFDLQRYDDIKALMNDRDSIDKMSDKKQFTTEEIVDFCKIWLMYYIGIEDVIAGEVYYQVLDTILEKPDTHSKYTIQMFILLKLDKEFIR